MNKTSKQILQEALEILKSCYGSEHDYVDRKWVYDLANKGLALAAEVNPMDNLAEALEEHNKWLDKIEKVTK